LHGFALATSSYLSSHLFLTLLLSFLGKLRPQGQIWGQRNKASFNHWGQLQPYTSFLVRGVDGASSAQRQAMARHS